MTTDKKDDGMEDFGEMMDMLGKKFKEEQERTGEVKLVEDLEYPLEISGVEIRPIRRGNRGLFPTHTIGCMVGVRPVDKQYEGKTFLGVYLGNLPVEIIAGYQTKLKNIVVNTLENPGIFVPELNKVIYGDESWWGEIESEEQLRQITDDDIQNVWYVKALHELGEKQKATSEAKA